MVAALCISPPARAWGAAGHQRIGAIAAALITASPAEAAVRSILGSTSLAAASVWADCVKGVDPAREFRYLKADSHPECSPFETPAEIARMQDFVRRNHANCKRSETTESCHKRYHYADAPIAHVHYDRRYWGTRADDIVAATHATLLKLQGQPVPAPFNIQDRREALLLLCHYLGDLHQPLHVGAVYLSHTGAVIDPQATELGQAQSTRGGNQLLLVGLPQENLHRLWDGLAAPVVADASISHWLRAARQVPSPKGRYLFWPGRWADDTLAAARAAFAGLAYRTAGDARWQVNLPADYSRRRTKIQRIQLAKAGARLAALLQALWGTSSHDTGTAGTLPTAVRLAHP